MNESKAIDAALALLDVFSSFMSAMTCDEIGLPAFNHPEVRKEILNRYADAVALSLEVIEEQQTLSAGILIDIVRNFVEEQSAKATTTLSE
jgi:hypothetical protein